MTDEFVSKIANVYLKDRIMKSHTIEGIVHHYDLRKHMSRRHRNQEN